MRALGSLLLTVLTLTFPARAERPPTPRLWVCESGFPHSAGGGAKAVLRHNPQGDYDLFVGTSPEDAGDPRPVVQPTLVENHLECQFSPARAGLLSCQTKNHDPLNQTVFNTKFVVETDLDDQGREISVEYFVVYLASNRAETLALIQKLTGGRPHLKYPVTPGRASQRCEFADN